MSVSSIAARVALLRSPLSSWNTPVEDALEEMLADTFDGATVLGATFARDGAGPIHAALYTFGDPASNDADVRYLVFAP